MKVSKNIQNRIERLYTMNKWSIELCDLPLLVKQLEDAKLTPADYAKLCTAYIQTMMKRSSENSMRQAMRQESLPPFNFDEWAETIN